MSKYKSAGFENTDESRKEAMKRMIDGEVFYLAGGSKFMFNAKAIATGSSPFEINGDRILGYWDMMDEWQIKTNWYNSITKPVPCRVRDDDKDNGIDLIKGHQNSKFPFIGHRCNWKYAEPLTCSELLESMEDDNG